MKFLYSLSVISYSLIIRIVSPFNAKAKKWVEGRKNWRKNLQTLIGDHENIIWVHAASLGEAEQGLPIIEKLKETDPECKILLSFFSPSGFENFKGHSAVDFCCYLPIDSPSNSRDFIEIVNPKLAVFIKYEIWVHYFKMLSQKNIPFFLTSALFREGQFYFKKPYSRFFLPILQMVNHIMVQNESSLQILQKNGLKNASICGETRIDRVLKLRELKFSDTVLENFTIEKPVLIAGSSWPIEESMIKEYLTNHPSLKVILAPHDISESHISYIQELYSGFEISLYSENKTKNSQILVIDNIGLLSRIYRFADIAFIGGGFGKGLHSTIEASVYGLPVLFGPKHQSFIEPSEMKKLGAGFEVKDQETFIKILSQLLENPEQLKEASEAAYQFVKSKSGAVDHILNKIKAFL